MNRILKVLIVIIIVIAIIFAGGIFYLTQGLEAGSKIQINELDMSDIKDGVYNGKYNSGRWSNVLDITVKDKKITDIKIIDDVTFPDTSIANELFGKVIKEQNIQVDTISGATVTTKAYLKSIENALSDN